MPTDYDPQPGPRPGPRPDLRPAARGFPWPALIVGVAAALALGVGVGLWTRPELLKPFAPMSPSAATAAAGAGGGQMNITVDAAREAAPAPAPSGGPMEVLPPDMAAAARAEAERALGPQVAALEPAPPEKAAAPALPRADCSRAESPAEQMVCADPGLMAADRRMVRAYDRALAAGAPADDLRAEQEDWLSIREDAARYSATAVADVYNQRIGELERMARPAD